MSFPLITPILDIVKTVIKGVIKDPEKQAEAEYKAAQLIQNGELKEAEIKISAILEEARSADKWTSRARPSFLYVIYVLILFSIPMGILHAFYPEISASIAEGMKEWLNAIPGDLYALFAVGYLGYAGARSFDKKTALKAWNGK